MKIVSFLNELGLGGTEKAAVRWAVGLVRRNHQVSVLTLEDGPRRAELERAGITVAVVTPRPEEIASFLRTISPEVIHAHVPGHPHKGDVLGEALALLPKIPVVSTNIFGRFDNPREDHWTDFRLFISWTSCVQAAQRSFRRLDCEFFRHASVASYPLDPDDGPTRDEIAVCRENLGVASDEILLGRFSRPEPNKWTNLVMEAFRIAARRSPEIKLLLREPPSGVAHQLANAPDRDRFIVLPTTSDPGELRLTMASTDVVLHTSIIGESFGYGIAEPMNYAKPVIANSTPWQDQAQIELVRHGECGFIASTALAIARRICELAIDPTLRQELGLKAQAHVRRLANPTDSLDRLESALRVALCAGENPIANQDLVHARRAAAYLRQMQFGDSVQEQLALRPTYYRARFYQFRHRFLHGTFTPVS